MSGEAVAQIFGRAAELESLRERLAGRKTTLLSGPSGVGKTLLLQRLLPGFNYVLYCPASSSPQAVCRCLAELLSARDDATLLRSCKGRPDALVGMSFVSLKGIVSSALRADHYLVVLDHLNRPSPAMGALLGELMLSCSTPVIAVARSTHMEDAGTVAALLPDRSERLALKNFDPETAKAFAREACLKQQLSGENLESVLDSIVRFSEGNPGAILRMIAMARQSKYRSDDHIKWSPLYIDFLLKWASESAL